MTTLEDKPFLSTLFPKERPPEFVLGYLRSSFLGRLHDLVLSTFLDLERRNEITKAELARRLKKSPSQITRWLSGPSNLELETVSDLLAGMGFEADVVARKIKNDSTQQLAKMPAANDEGAQPISEQVRQQDSSWNKLSRRPFERGPLNAELPELQSAAR